MAAIGLLFFWAFSVGIRVISSLTDPQDAAVLQSLKDQWENTPPSWANSSDPCGTAWEGISCNNARVTALQLSNMGLQGRLIGDIGGLTELISLDLSFNRGLTGPVPPELGLLQNLTILILAGCGFSGNIPDELGNLVGLSFLALNSNSFTGEIPSSLGKLSNLYWLDLSDNQLAGRLPVSPGLDLLLRTKHFHLSKNQLSGIIPAKLFSSEMVLIHLRLDGNNLTGSIPDTIGLVQTLEVLTLDRNVFSGNVPRNLNNLKNLIELNLANNKLAGPLPDLTGMNSLNYVDLGNNSFDQSEAPAWFGTLQSLTTLAIEYGSLQGPIPQKLFSLPQLQAVKLKNNTFNGTLNMGNSVGQQLQLVDLQNNQISSVTLSSNYKYVLMLNGNPVCSAIPNTTFCQQQPTLKPYSTSLANCGNQSCPPDQKLSPQNCACAYPYEGTMFFRAPFFRDLSNAIMFHSLEMSLWVQLSLTPGSVFLQNPNFNTDDYLQLQVGIFPSPQTYFNSSEIQRIGFALVNQTFKPPPEFGPYFFIASLYNFV